MKLTPSNFLEKGYYAVTINPSDKHQYFGKNDRLKLFRNFLHEQLLQLSQWKIGYALCLELSEPKSNSQCSKNGPRLHVHGIIRFTSTLSIKNFLLMGVYNITRYANYDIDTIDDMQIWYDYCHKQQHIMKEKEFTNHNDLWADAIKQHPKVVNK